MRTRSSFWARFTVASVLAIVTLEAYAQTSHKLQLTRSGSQIGVHWPTVLTNAQGAALRPEYVLERSHDLEHWQPTSGPLRALSGSEKPFSFFFPDSEGPTFFRVKADLEATTSPTGAGGGEVLGYSGTLREELGRIGIISTAQFRQMYPEPSWLPQIDFDPTQARFWTNFATPIAEWNVALPANSPERRVYDFRLSPAELELFKRNGFVVSERLGAQSFGDIYYKLWTDDMPVFVTTDSILQAWHRTFENMMVEVEELELAQTLREALAGARSRLQSKWGLGSYGVLRDNLLEADFFLTVAASLLEGTTVRGVIPGTTLVNDWVRTALADVAGEGIRDVAYFGSNSLRTVDFSMFKPRGHYTKITTLQNYFRAMMWCGLIDLRIAAYEENPQNDLHQFGTALVLASLNHRYDYETAEFLEFHDWSRLENLLSGLFGPADSMTSQQLRQLAESQGILDITYGWITEPQLVALHQKLLTGELGTQLILGYSQGSPLSPFQLRLPRSYTFLGHRFALDSWALGQVVFDRVLWPDAGHPGVVKGKVIRRKPHCLDVAFAVFGNNNVADDIASLIETNSGVPFRDGKPYQHNLAAVRNVIDAKSAASWSGTVYEQWLAVLRTLSDPASATNSGLPQAMRTRAWSMKDVNSQVSGWTQLRHDALLYVKQSYTPPFLCDYPDGFVEPRPEFFRSMAQLAELCRQRMAQVTVTGTVRVPDPDAFYPAPNSSREVSIKGVRAKRDAFLRSFQNTMLTLEGMAAAELQQRPFSPDQAEFIRNLADNRTNYLGERQYSGWYPHLYYSNCFAGTDFNKNAGCDYADPIVVDVHTDLPDQIVGDPGAVIHEGVGYPNLLMIAVDNGTNKTVYAGPVLSHFEFEKPSGTRLTDEQWSGGATPASAPPRDAWTRSYLVPVK